MKRAYQPIFDWFGQQYPSLVPQWIGDEQEDPARWNALLKSVRWDKGDSVRGGTIFTERGCQVCHSGATALGPDLGGVTGRFSISDLFDAIIYPSRQVAPAYLTTTFQTAPAKVSPES